MGRLQDGSFLRGVAFALAEVGGLEEVDAEDAAFQGGEVEEDVFAEDVAFSCFVGVCVG